MRPSRIIAILAVACSAWAMAAEKPDKPVTSPSEMMRLMRLAWLTRKPAMEGSPEAAQDKVMAVVMDWPLDGQVVTVLASSEGDASVYTTGTFGMTGGIGHETVRKAAVAFVASAQKHVAMTSPASDLGYPSRREIRFYFVMPRSTRVVTLPEDELQKPGSPASELFAHGQRVLTELRVVTESQRGVLR